MIIRVLLVAALTALVAYGFSEVRRWSTPEGRSFYSQRQRTIRAWGFFFLISSLSLWLVGTGLQAPRTKHAALLYMAYWLFTVLMTVPCLVLAIIDARLNMRRISEVEQELAEERRRLFQTSTPDEP